MRRKTYKKGEMIEQVSMRWSRQRVFLKRKTDTACLEMGSKEKRNSENLKSFCQVKNRGCRNTNLGKVGRKLSSGGEGWGGDVSGVGSWKGVNNTWNSCYGY